MIPVTPAAVNEIEERTDHEEKNFHTVKILLTIALLLAVGTGVLAWAALGPSSAPADAALSVVESTEAEIPTTQETAPIVENWPLPTQETAPRENERERTPAVLKLSKQKGGSLEAEHYIRREDIATITFLSSLTNAPEDAWDASEEKNGAILAWTVPSTSADGLLDLYIGSDQRISAGSEVDLSDFYNLRELNNLNQLDTSGITSLRYAFYGMAKDSGDRLELDLSGWDVSSVTDFSLLADGIITKRAGTDLRIDASSFHGDAPQGQSLVLSHV